MELTKQAQISIVGKMILKELEKGNQICSISEKDQFSIHIFDKSLGDVKEKSTDNAFELQELHFKQSKS